MTPAERARLIEEAAGAFRSRDRDGNVRAHPAWHDLDPGGRLEAARVATASRVLESCLDRNGLSSTTRAVLSQIISRS